MKKVVDYGEFETVKNNMIPLYMAFPINYEYLKFDHNFNSIFVNQRFDSQNFT